MDIFLQLVTTVSLVTIAAAAVLGATELRTSRHLLEEVVYRDFTSSPPPPGNGPDHAVFICKDGGWVLAADMSGPGHQASPPTMEPSYEGQVVKRSSVPTNAN